MAKKKTTKKTATKTEQVVEEKKLPRPAPNEITFVLSMDEIFAAVQVMGFARDLFKQMSLNCAVEGDIKSEQVYLARSELSATLFNRFRAIASIGEPTSRTFH